MYRIRIILCVKSDLCSTGRWRVFRVIVHDAVDSVESALSARSTVVMQAIDGRMEEFLLKILQLDPLTISQDHTFTETAAS